MTAADAIKEGMKRRSMTMAKLAERMGFKNAQVVSNRLANKSGMRIDTLIRFMNAMGYDVVIKDRMNDAEIVLTMGEEEK